ncbi:MAG: hypothetical protein ACRYGA_02155 [Janthinobacterium lividum]
MTGAPQSPALPVRMPVPVVYVDPKFVWAERRALVDQVQMQHMTGRTA